MSIVRTPNVLVLGGGGILGEAWMSGFLAGRGEAGGVDFREADCFVGTSAGSIVAAFLAAGVEPRRPRDGGAGGEGAAGNPTAARAGDAEDLSRAGQVAATALSSLAGPALGITGPGGALARAAVLSRIPAGSRTLDDLRARIAQLGVGFDGRLRIAVVHRASGRRVLFGSSDAPEATVEDAVLASCAIPGVFRPVTIGGREYVDGGVWSPTNVDAAPAGRGDHVLCLVPTAAMGRESAGAMRSLATGWRVATRVEAAALRRRGATVDVVGPDERASAAMGLNLMDPRPRHRVLAEGFRQGGESVAATAKAG